MLWMKTVKCTNVPRRTYANNDIPVKKKTGSGAVWSTMPQNMDGKGGESGA